MVAGRPMDRVCWAVGVRIYTYLQGLGVRQFADNTDQEHLLTPAVVARRQVHRVFRAGPGCQDAGERHDTRRKPVSTPGTLGQLSNGESVSFRTWHKCLDLPEGSGCSQSELLLDRPGQRTGA